MAVCNILYRGSLRGIGSTSEKHLVRQSRLTIENKGYKWQLVHIIIGVCAPPLSALWACRQVVSFNKNMHACFIWDDPSLLGILVGNDHSCLYNSFVNQTVLVNDMCMLPTIAFPYLNQLVITFTLCLWSNNKLFSIEMLNIVFLVPSFQSVIL